MVVRICSKLDTIPGLCYTYRRMNAINANKAQKKYVTYIAPDMDAPGKIYVGRSSGYGTPQQILNRRKAGHHRNLGDLELDQMSESYAAIRGREHLVPIRITPPPAPPRGGEGRMHPLP